jgi:hypothetical protein
MDWARLLAGRVLDDSGLSPEQQVERAYRLVFSRAPKPEESRLISDFLHQQSGLLSARMANGEKVPIPASVPQGMLPAEAAAFVELCHTLLNSNEFIYMN